MSAGYGSIVGLPELPDFGGRQICSTVDPDLFFPDKPGQEAIHARKLAPMCQACPVKDLCLKYALEHSVEGIWAGTTTRQRRQLRRDSGARIDSQQARAAKSRATVHTLAAKGLNARQIVDQTGLHEQTVWRALRAFHADAHRDVA